MVFQLLPGANIIIDNKIDSIRLQVGLNGILALMASSATSSTRVETVVKQLRQGVFEGRYPPGTALRELSLARDLSVSQATVREALDRLSHTGLGTRSP